MHIPKTGTDRETLFERLEAYRSHDMHWQDGRTFAYIYDAGREAMEVGKEAYKRFLTENGLDPTAFPSLLRFENEVVSMIATHLGGGPEAVGTFTSGGTESIILACKSARDHARASRPEIFGQGRAPELILPVTAHAAFHKAAHYLGLKVVAVPVDPLTFKADVAAVRAAITDGTALIVGSAPSYAHGVIDPIAELAAVAAEHGVLMHVDACVGGFLLPYWRRLGEPVPAFDLSVPGVTSLSVDLHKYGFCPKGASLVLYNDANLREKQAFACAQWSGYSVINMAVQSSKTGGPLAAAWAVLNFLGDAGYLEIARQMLAGTRALVAGIEAVDGLRLLARPDFCMVSVASDEVSVYHVVDEMAARGWTIQAQFAFQTSPANIHFSLAPANAARVEEMLADLRQAVQAARALPSGQMAAGVAAMFEGVDLTALDPSVFAELLAMGGLTGTELPERMAPINEVLDALPRPVCEVLLKGFLNQLFRQPQQP